MAKAHNRIELDEKRIIELYKQGKSSGEIGKELGVCSTVILRRLRENGITRRSQNTYDISTEELHDKYILQKLSSREIASHYGCSSRYIITQLKARGIPTRKNIDKDAFSVEERKHKYGSQKENHPLWKGGVTSVSGLIRNRLAPYSKTRLQLDNYTCNLCGRTSGDMHVHHKVRFSEIVQDILKENPSINLLNEHERISFVDICENDVRLTSIDNLETLCRNCHKGVHKEEEFNPIRYEIVQKQNVEYIKANCEKFTVSEIAAQLGLRSYKVHETIVENGLKFAYENKEWLAKELKTTCPANIAKHFNSVRYKVRASHIKESALILGII